MIVLLLHYQADLVYLIEVSYIYHVAYILRLVEITFRYKEMNKICHRYLFSDTYVFEEQNANFCEVGVWRGWWVDEWGEGNYSVVFCKFIQSFNENKLCY